MEQTPQFLIIGPGAVGIGLAVILAEAGNRVGLYGRSGLRPSATLKLGDDIHTAQFLPFDQSSTAYAIMTTKAYDVVDASRQYEKYLQSCKTILCLQNGLGVVEQLTGYPNVLKGVLWVSGERAGSDTAFWRSKIKIFLDANDQRAVEIGGLLSAAGVRIELTGKFQSEVYRKLAVNMAYNPTSTLYRIVNSEIRNHPEARSRAIRAAEEIHALARADGAPFESDVVEMVDRGAATLGDFKSSTLQDLEAGRPLEMQSLLAEPIKLAERLGVPAPELQSLYSDLQQGFGR